MNRVLKGTLWLFTVVFTLIGVRWLADPAGAALQFGYPLAEGLGRSSQIGDMAGFFITCGVCIAMALTTARKLWYYPPIILMLLTAFGRSLAWLVHDASLAIPEISVELVLAALLLIAIRRLPTR